MPTSAVIRNGFQFLVEVVVDLAAEAEQPSQLAAVARQARISGARASRWRVFFGVPDVFFFRKLNIGMHSGHRKMGIMRMHFMLITRFQG